MDMNLTEIVAIINKSGSMKALAEDTVGGYNNFIEKQKELPGNAVLTTVLSNISYKVLHDRKPIKKAKPIDIKDFVAKGKSALLDALGDTINDIGLKLFNTPEAERPGKVIFFIITDSLDTASKEYTHDKIKYMVEQQHNVYKWEFIFVGANLDVNSLADSMGIYWNRYEFKADKKGITTAFKTIGDIINEQRKHVNAEPASEPTKPSRKKKDK